MQAGVMQPHTALASEVSFRLEEKAVHSFVCLIVYQQVVSIADAWTCAISSHFLFLAHGLQSECWGKSEFRIEPPSSYILEVKSWKKEIIPSQLHREYNFLTQFGYSCLLENAHKPDQTVQTISEWELESAKICLASRFVGDKWFQGQFINASKWRQMLTSRGRIM